MTSQTLEQLLAEPQWQRAVRYSYSPATNVYTFFLPGHGMQMVPIALFSPIVRQDILAVHAFKQGRPWECTAP